jgi:hypothetical protein
MNIICFFLFLAFVLNEKIMVAKMWHCFGTIFTSVPMKADMIRIYLSEWVEPYDLTQYIIFITNINIHMCSLLGEVAGGSLQSKIV